MVRRRRQVSLSSRGEKRASTERKPNGGPSMVRRGGWGASVAVQPGKKGASAKTNMKGVVVAGVTFQPKAGVHRDGNGWGHNDASPGNGAVATFQPKRSCAQRDKNERGPKMGRLRGMVRCHFPAGEKRRPQRKQRMIGAKHGLQLSVTFQPGKGWWPQR